MARATTTRSDNFEAYNGVACVNGGCVTLTGQALIDQLKAAGMIRWFQVTCQTPSPGGTYCTRKTIPQTWVGFYLDRSTTGNVSVTTPTSSYLGKTKNGFNILCKETNDQEYYTCSVSAGYPGYSWSLDVYF
jgi:hypothetical protein